MSNSHAKQILSNAKSRGDHYLLEPYSSELLNIYSIPPLRSTLVQSKDQAFKVSQKIGYPQALKIVSPDIIHKSDVGGVVLNILDESDLLAKYDELIRNVKLCNPEARICGVLMQEMARKGVEVTIGTTHDAQFGPVIMFGLGGIFVEIMDDVVFRVLPIGEDDTHEMINSLKASPLLTGARGEPCDTKALSSMILNAGKMTFENPEILQMDLNPVVAHRSGATVVDVRIYLGNGD